MKVKNVIFDFGNVLFDLDLGKIPHSFAQMTTEKGREGLSLHHESGFFHRYEKGEMSTESFLETLSRCDKNNRIPKETIRGAWNSIFVDFPSKRLDMLLELRKKGYFVVLLSNINDLHLAWIHDYLEHEHGILDFETRFFDKVYYSHLIGMRKPDAEIYRHVLADAGIQAEETVFFDDLPENIQTANSMGIKGIWHPIGTEICERVWENLD